MKLNELAPAAGAKTTRRRVGRGIGSGLGKTSGRGHKGQKSRAGASIRPGFEGGQTPLHRRLPKRGFNNTRFALEQVVVNLSALNVFEAGSVVSPEDLVARRIISNVKDGVVVLGGGEMEKSLTIRAHRFSRTAAGKIEAAGGKAEVI
jgi:large subunit ribosomal protein L15